MKSLPNSDFDAKAQALVKLYVKLTNHTLHMTRVATCCHNVHAVISLHTGIKDSIGTRHHVAIFYRR